MYRRFCLLCFCFLPFLAIANNLPNGFVYLRDIDPSIQQDMRYAGYHNFIGHPLPGYQANTCILTKVTALTLKQIQAELRQSKLSLKVYDCYRPQTTVNAFIKWSKDAKQQAMKAEFYPRINKVDFFKLGYVAKRSGHSRGSTVDLTLIPIGSKSAKYRPGHAVAACFAPYRQRFQDNSIDMGTGFDCMDELAHPLNNQLGKVVYFNRMMLRQIMLKYGFVPLAEEWWHFTLKQEPFKNSYFNFFPLLHE
ncbi:M15 family metallopeptidase [soil metagenome]